MTRSRARREIDLFNFSFLDILACVIGLLIFILTIVAVSGGKPASAAAAKLSEADQRKAAAVATAQEATDRRAKLEAMLTQRTADAADPEKAEASIEAEISVLREQADALDTSAAAVRRQIAETEAQAQAIAADKTTAAATPDIRRQIDQLNQQIAGLDVQATKIHAQQAPEHVLYYIPHVQQTDKHQIWLEVSGSRCWMLPGDFDERPVDLDATEYTRRADAPGFTVAGIVQGSNVPLLIHSAAPQDTVIVAIVRPDGFAGYRKLREWAWSHRFAVNWVPLDSDDTIVLGHVAHGTQQ